MFSIYGRESFVQWTYNNLLVIFYFWIAEGEREGHLEPGSHGLPNHPDVYHLVLLWLGQDWVMNVSSCIFHINRCPYQQTNLETCVVTRKRRLFFQWGKRWLLIIILKDMFMLQNPGNKSQLFQGGAQILPVGIKLCPPFTLVCTQEAAWYIGKSMNFGIG